MIDRFLTGLRNQGPGAIPALILSLLALGGVAYWLLSRDDDQPTPTAEVVSAPATTTPDAVAPPASSGSGSGSGSNAGGGGGSDQDSPGTGGPEAGPATEPVAPVPPDSGGGSEVAPPADEGASSNGGQGSHGDKPPSLEDIQQLLQGGNRKPDHQNGSGALPGLENLFGNGSGSADQAPSGSSIQDLLDQIQNQK